MVQGDLDEPTRPTPKLSLADLDAILERPTLLPAGLTVKKLQAGEYSYDAPGVPKAIRVTTRAAYYEEHGESTELWSPGSPAFPEPDSFAQPDELTFATLAELLVKADGTHRTIR